MNRALPPGDRGRRSSDPGRASGLARAVPGALGLFGGVANPAGPTTRNAAGGEAGGASEQTWSQSGGDRVAAFAAFPFGGDDLQSQLLADRPGEEPAHGVRLPPRG